MARMYTDARCRQLNSNIGKKSGNMYNASPVKSVDICKVKNVAVALLMIADSTTTDRMGLKILTFPLKCLTPMLMVCTNFV